MYSNVWNVYYDMCMIYVWSCIYDMYACKCNYVCMICMYALHRCVMNEDKKEMLPFALKFGGVTDT